MSTTVNEQPTDEKKSSMEILKVYADRYGYLTFGVVTFLILWIGVVTPQLARRDLDFENQRAVIESLNRTLDTQQSMMKDQERLSTTMQGTAGTMKDAATILERVSDKLDSKLE